MFANRCHALVGSSRGAGVVLLLNSDFASGCARRNSCHRSTCNTAARRLSNARTAYGVPFLGRRRDFPLRVYFGQCALAQTQRLTPVLYHFACLRFFVTFVGCLLSHQFHADYFLNLEIMP